MIRGAIIGFGKIAQTGHAPAYLDPLVHKQVRIVAVVEPNPVYRQQAAELFEGVHLYETPTDLLRLEALDFVDICTPPDTHAQLIRLYVARKLHVLCEKPFVRDLREARESADYLHGQPNLVFMPCHQYRYSPVWKPFKELVMSSPAVSRNLLQFTVCRMQADPGYLADNPNWRTEQKISGGGILADTGVHYIYLVRWILGLPRRISAHVLNLHHQNMKVEDTAIVIIECERGIAEITLTWAADRRANSAQLVNHTSSLAYNGNQLERSTPAGLEQLPVPDASDKSQYVKLYISLIEEFASRVATGRPDPEWIDEAFQSIEVLQACYQAAATGRSVQFDEVGAGSVSPR